MLPDNAQLARVYLHAWQLTHDAAYLAVARSTLDFVAHEMTLPDGVFAASLDADTEGEEGATYAWTARGVREALEAAGHAADAELFAAAFDVTPGGNWDGRTILRRVATDSALATRTGRAEADVSRRLAAARAALLQVRDSRSQPARDDKALAGWNGLMLAAFADAAAALARMPDATIAGAGRRYRDIAERAGDRLLAVLVDEGGRLRRSWKDGQARHAGTLEDHACLADGLLALYEATANERWFTAARALADTILAHFGDAAGGFFDTADDAERLVARPRSLEDNALPSGNAMAALVLQRLDALTGEGRYADAAEGALGLVGSAPARYPTAFAQWLVALDWRRLSPAPGDRGRARPRGERGAAPAGPVRDPGHADRVRLPGVRLPPARDRAGGARGAPGGLSLLGPVSRPPGPPLRSSSAWPGGSEGASGRRDVPRARSATRISAGCRRRATRCGT